MAEGLFQAELGDTGIRIESAGLAAPDGVPPHAEAIRLMAGLGIDIRGILSRQVTPAMALAADLILVMDARQKHWCGEVVPSARGRIFLLGAWLPPARRDIEDPFRRGPEAFLQAFELIQEAVAAWLRHLRPARKPHGS